MWNCFLKGGLKTRWTFISVYVVVWGCTIAMKLVHV